MESDGVLEPPVVPPGAIKVFGIFHLILGSIGLIMAFGTVVMQLGQAKVLKMAAAAMPEEIREEYIELTLEYAESLAMVTYFDFAARLLLSVLILVAGIALLKVRKTALKKSQLYAWLSIGLKGVMVVVAAAWVGPMTAQYYDALFEMQSGTGAALPTGAVALQKNAGIAAQVITPVVSMIYPILVLILLGRPPVKKYVAEYGN